MSNPPYPIPDFTSAPDAASWRNSYPSFPSSFHPPPPNPAGEGPSRRHRAPRNVHILDDSDSDDDPIVSTHAREPSDPPTPPEEFPGEDYYNVKPPRYARHSTPGVNGQRPHLTSDHSDIPSPPPPPLGAGPGPHHRGDHPASHSGPRQGGHPGGYAGHHGGHPGPHPGMSGATPGGNPWAAWAPPAGRHRGGPHGCGGRHPGCRRGRGQHPGAFPFGFDPNSNPFAPGNNPWGEIFGAAARGNGPQTGFPNIGEMAKTFAEQFGIIPEPDKKDGKKAKGKEDDDEDEIDFEPPVDVFDAPGAYVVHVSLPGAKKDEVGLTWDEKKGELEVRGFVERRFEGESARSTFLERDVGLFRKVVKLGGNAKDKVDGNKIAAKMEDGVLMVRVAKVDQEEEFVEVKKVDIL